MAQMDEVVSEVSTGRAHLNEALNRLEQIPGMTCDTDELSRIVGDLAGMLSSWEQERDRWRG